MHVVVKEFVHEFRTGKYAAACDRMTERAQAGLGKAAKGSCARGLAVSRALVGDDRLARDEKAADSLPITISGNTASSPSLEKANSEVSRYVYRGGRWLID